jgi:hypothetical protein
MKSLSTRWRCPNCERSSTRRWNLERHINRWHGGSGQPYNNDRILYDRPLLLQQHIPPTTSYISNPDSTQKSYKQFDLFVDRILKQYHTLVEIKNLRDQLSARQQPQQVMPTVYPGISSMISNIVESNNSNTNYNLSEPYQFDDLEIFGYRGHVCERCLLIHPLAIYHRKSGQTGNIEMKHQCSSKRLNDVQQKPDKDKIITDLYKILPEVMKKTVKSWTNNQTRIVAIEVPSHTVPNNCFDLTPTTENHWAARVVRDKQAFLNDEELSEFLQKVRDTTCAFFRINIEESAYFYIMMLQKFKSIYFQ